MRELEADAPNRFTLSAENFGPIARATVDLRPLTVFAGPSNTGKSYMAILAYALHKCFGPPRFPRYGRQRAYPSYSWPTASMEAAPDRPAATRDWLLDAQKWLLEVSPGSDRGAVPTSLADHIRPALEQTEGLDRYFETELTRCFGIEHCRDLIRRPGSHQASSVTLTIPQKDRNASIVGSHESPEAVRYEFTFARRQRPEPSGSISVSAPLSVGPEYLDELRESFIARLRLSRTDEWEELSDGELEHLMSQVSDTILLSLFHPLTSNAFYLPASRTGVMHSHQTVVSALIQSATAAGRRPTARVPVLSGVLADFLDDLLALPRGLSHDPMAAPRAHRLGLPTREGFHGLANQLEENVLKGAIGLERGETNYPIFNYRPSGWKHELPLMRTSSMVSELAPVVLYLRYLVRPGDLFIIEEPESHLHPAMQTAFAGELARLVHSGVQVLLTTHSEWFLEQIGNLVRLSELSEKSRSGIRGADVALRPDQVGAWLFRPKLRPRGSVVEEIPFERETGLYRAGYDEVSESLYNEGAEVFNRLQRAAVE